MFKLSITVALTTAALALAGCKPAAENPGDANANSASADVKTGPDERTGPVERTGPDERTGPVERTGPDERTGTEEQ